MSQSESPLPDTGFQAAAPSEIVNATLLNVSLFKKAGRELEQRPSDEVAARVLISAYQAQRAEPWLTAFLLGCIRHHIGYDVVRKILLEDHPQLAASYAGTAMALIAGQKAAEDLTDILESATSWRVCEGAMYGLEELNHTSAVPSLIKAYRLGRLKPSHTPKLVAEVVTGETLLCWLRSNVEIDIRLACKVIAYRLQNIQMAAKGSLPASEMSYTDCALSQELAAAVAQVLAAGQISLHPRTRALLSDWTRK